MADKGLHVYVQQYSIKAKTGYPRTFLVKYIAIFKKGKLNLIYFLIYLEWISKLLRINRLPLATR